MHYLHEFHRQQLHSREHRITALEAEKRATEAERLAGVFEGKAREGNGVEQSAGGGGGQRGKSGESPSRLEGGKSPDVGAQEKIGDWKSDDVTVH